MIKAADFRLLYVGEKGTHVQNVKREDGLISNIYQRLMIISHPKFGDTYVDYIHWDIDDRVDIKVSDRSTIPELEELRTIKFSSRKYNNEAYDNIFTLQYLLNGKKNDHTLQSLSDVVGSDIKQYLKEKHIKLLKKDIDRYHTTYYCIHSHYSYSDILEIYLISVFIPFLISKPALTTPKPINKTSSSFTSFKEKMLIYSFVAVLLTGCYTCATRKRIGAVCNDGSASYSTGSGTCSHHGGVRRWKYEYWWNR